MKVAVCFSGLPRGPFLDNLEVYKKIFDGYDFFYSTWSGHDLSIEHMSFPEPNSDYLQRNKGHLKSGVYEDLDYMFTVNKKIPLEEIIRTCNSYKQHVAHALQLVFQVPKEYDMILRCRYDVLPLETIDWKNLVEKSYRNKTTYGFRAFPLNYRGKPQDFGPFHPEGKPFDWKIMWPSDTSDKHDMFDNMIFHPRNHFDSIYALSLYHDEMLFGGEKGWYQIMKQSTDRFRHFKGGLLLNRDR